MTLKDVASRLGLSHTTVSRALQDHPRISVATRSAVKACAAEMGYMASTTAAHLAHGRSKLIAVIVPDLTIHFYARVIEGIQEILEKEGFSILLFNTRESLEAEELAVSQCLKHRVDGVLAAISRMTKTHSHFQKLLKHDIPLVFFDRVVNFLPVPKVVTNDHQAAYHATQHLILSGCKCIGHITASMNLNNSNNRLYGYLDALKDASIGVEEALIHYYEFDPASIDAFIENTLGAFPQLDGLFVFNDYVANIAVNALQRLGKSIPADVAVMGFSDEPVAVQMTPRLSTVQQTGAKMGQLSAQKMLALIGGHSAPDSEKIVIDPQLVIRDSTRTLEPGR